MIAGTDTAPILVTGSHRSGSTWLASMLALAGDTLMVHEPFNIESGSYALDGLLKHWFAYAPALPQDAALAAFGKVLGCDTGKVFPRRQIQHWVPFARRGRLVIKDPMALTSSEWLAENFGLKVIALVRHPAAFAASLKRMRWEFPFEHLLEQKLLMNDHLQAYREEIERCPSGTIARAALLWKCLYGVLFTYLDRNPGWVVRTHERLSLEPVAELKGLYGTLGLGWTDTVESQVKAHTRKGNPVIAPEGVLHHIKRDSAASATLWKKHLTAEEIRVVYENTHDVARRYYPDEEW